jgi:hypothetical protein
MKSSYKSERSISLNPALAPMGFGRERLNPSYESEPYFESANFLP